MAPLCENISAYKIHCHKQYTFIIILWKCYENIFKTVQLKPIRVTLIISRCGSTVPQIECPLGGSSKKDSYIYFMLIVAMVLLL